MLLLQLGGKSERFALWWGLVRLCPLELDVSASQILEPRLHWRKCTPAHHYGSLPQSRNKARRLFISTRPIALGPLVAAGLDALAYSEMPCCARLLH